MDDLSQVITIHINEEISVLDQMSDILAGCRVELPIDFVGNVFATRVKQVSHRYFSFLNCATFVTGGAATAR